MSRESEQLDGEFAKEVDELRRRYVRLVKGIVEELAKEKGIRKNTPPDTAVFLLFGMMNWMYTWYDRERDGEPHVVAKQISRIFLHGILE